MILQIMNQKEWIDDQLEILNHEFKNNPITITQKEEVLIWLDQTDLIQILTENFDCEAELSSTIDFTNADFAANTSLALPIYPELSDEQITFVVECIKQFLA